GRRNYAHNAYFGIVPFENFNFAFSLPLPAGLMYIVYAIILAAIFYYLLKQYKQLSTAAKFAWLLVVTGALCNVLERIVLGYVRDFIYVFSGIFNLADG